jgi:hypothetical protein
MTATYGLKCRIAIRERSPLVKLSSARYGTLLQVVLASDAFLAFEAGSGPSPFFIRTPRRSSKDHSLNSPRCIAPQAMSTRFAARYSPIGLPDGSDKAG